jgi:hypothetical protein
MAPRKSSTSSAKDKDKDDNGKSSKSKSDEIKKYIGKAKETFYEVTTQHQAKDTTI